MQYILKYINQLPPVYLLCIIAISCVLYFILNKIKLGKFKSQKFSATILFAYALYVFLSVLVIRSSGVMSGFEVNPFWAYEKISNGGNFWPEIICNILLGVPIGALLIPILSVWIQKQFWQVVSAISVGCLFSIMIESLQYFLQRGLADLGDVFNNTLGATIGALICICIVNLRRKIRKI